jgi:hypothetical protein
MKLADFAALFLDVLRAYESYPEALPLGKNKSRYFGKEELSQEQLKQNKLSLADHIVQITQRPEIKGTTLLQKYYKYLESFVSGEDRRAVVNISAQDLATFQRYIALAKLDQERVVNDERGSSSYSLQPPSALQGSQWYVYTYEEYDVEDRSETGRTRNVKLSGIGLTILSIDHTWQAEVKNFRQAVAQPTYNTDYVGRVEAAGGSAVILSLRAPNYEHRTVQAILPIHMADAMRFTTGAYLSRDHLGNLVAGSLIMYRVEAAETQGLEPQFYPTGSDAFQTLPRPVQEYLYEKQHSHIKVSRMLTSAVALNEWLDNKREEYLRRPDRYTTFEHDIFLACPISSLQQHEPAELRTWLREMRAALQARGYARVFCPVIDLADVSQLWKGSHAKQSEILHQIQRSRYFMMLYPETAVSSALVEIGWALSHRKPCIIFQHLDSRLPQILEMEPSPKFMVPLHRRSFRNQADVLTCLAEDQDLFDWG